MSSVATVIEAAHLILLVCEESGESVDCLRRLAGGKASDEVEQRGTRAVDERQLRESNAAIAPSLVHWER
jgi:hypothetical protein